MADDARDGGEEAVGLPAADVYVDEQLGVYLMISFCDDSERVGKIRVCYIR
jgi:hypothetical protein